MYLPGVEDPKPLVQVTVQECIQCNIPSGGGCCMDASKLALYPWVYIWVEAMKFKQYDVLIS